VCYKALHFKHDLKSHSPIHGDVCVCVCVCAVYHRAAMLEQNMTCVTCLQCRIETDGTLTVLQRGTGAVADSVFCTAADLLGASYDEPTKIELNSV
jgi:hypothetical protein